MRRTNNRAAGEAMQLLLVELARDDTQGAMIR
jgi:hypothetical protein